MNEMQFKIYDVNVTVEHCESVFMENKEKYTFEKDGVTFSAIVERLDASTSMQEAAKMILNTNINLV